MHDSVLLNTNLRLLRPERKLGETSLTETIQVDGSAAAALAGHEIECNDREHSERRPDSEPPDFRHRHSSCSV